MRVHLLPIFLVTAASCSNSSSPNQHVDASNLPHPDASADAAVDAPPDGTIFLDAPADAPGSNAKTRVWAIGDYLVDNTPVAGAFEDGATLPFNTANPPAIVVPAGAHKLYTAAAKTGANQNPAVDGARFSATLDGSKIAFVADSLVNNGRFDLFVANGDGTNPTVVVSGAATTNIAAIAISPDGKRIAFTRDSVAMNNFDLYVVPTDASAAEVQVSPARTLASSGTDVFAGFSWSSDSKYVAFSGDLDTDKFDQAYVVDATAATPTAVVVLAKTDIATQTSGAQGVRGKLVFDANDNVYFRARVATANNSQFTFFTATVAGVRTDLTSLAPLRGDASTPDIGTFGITPDGTKLVFATDTTMGNYDLYVNTVGTTTVARVTTIAAAGAPSFLNPLVFAPDGKHVAYTFKATGGRTNAVVSDLAGTDTHRLVDVAAVCQAANGGTACTSPDAQSLQWAANGSAIYLMGDITLNNANRLYRIDPTMTDQTPTLAVDGAANTAVVTDLVTTIEP